MGQVSKPHRVQIDEGRIMSAADQIQEQLQRSLARAERAARQADAASEVAVFEGAKDACDQALKERRMALRAIKPKPVKVKRGEGESAAVAEARGHQAKATSEADAEMERIEEMETMHPIAKQLDQVGQHLQAAKARLASLMGTGGQSA